MRKKWVKFVQKLPRLETYRHIRAVLAIRLFNHTTNRRISKELNMKSWLKRGAVPTFDIACGISSGTGSLTLNENQDK